MVSFRFIMIHCADYIPEASILPRIIATTYNVLALYSQIESSLTCSRHWCQKEILYFVFSNAQGQRRRVAQAR